MNEIIMQQILAIRETGERNMFDLPVVPSIALRAGYTELVDYLEKNKGICPFHFDRGSENRIT